MSRRERIRFWAAVCLAMPLRITAAEPSGPPPIASLRLNDGRLLHHLTVMSDEGASIVVHADEGLLKLDRSNLPDSFPKAGPIRPSAPAGPEWVMQPFDPDKVLREPGEESLPKQTPKRGPTPLHAPNSVGDSALRGCSIISFHNKPFQIAMGCAEVVIRNDTDAPVEIRPGEILAVTTLGTHHKGRAFATDGFPPKMKRHEAVPAHGEVDDLVIFTKETLEISAVQWAR